VKRKLFVSGANFFALRVPRRIYSEELGDGRSDIDVVNVFQGSSLEVRAGGIKYRLHLGQPRVVTVLSEKCRRLKEVADRHCCARAEVQVITRDRHHQNISSVVAECVKVLFSAALLLLLIAGEIRFFAKDVFLTRLFQNDVEDALVGNRISDSLEGVFDLLL